MKIIHVVLISVVVFCIGYLAGQFIPWDFLRPPISSNEMSSSDYYMRMIRVNFIGAIATFFAIFVALFKEDIIKLYENASLEVNFKDKSNIISEVLASEPTTSDNKNIVANRYEIILEIKNHGKLPAKGCQICLEEVKLKLPNYPSPMDIKIAGKPLPWVGKTESSITITSEARAYVNVVQIIPPEAGIVSAEKSNEDMGEPQIDIAGAEFSMEHSRGIYSCDYMIYSENSSPVEFKLKIDWNGRWQQRLSEMKNCITVTHEKSKK
jgi:hypothetical protein